MNYNEILKTGQARTAFIKGLVRLAKADNMISPEESMYFLSAAASLGLDEMQIAEIDHSISSEDFIAVDFESDTEKLLFIREGIQLCAVDKSYDENEKAEIRMIAAEMAVPEAAVLKIEAWVSEGMEWKNRGDELLTIGLK